MENMRLQWNLDLTKGQGTDKISKAPNDGFLLNSLKTRVSVPRVLLGPVQTSNFTCTEPNTSTQTIKFDC